MSNGSLLFLPEDNLERNACHHLVIDYDVDGVESGLFEFDLLQIENEIAGVKEDVLRQLHMDFGFNVGQDVFAIFINEPEFEFVGAFIDIAKDDADRDGTMRMRGRQARSNDRIESAEDAEFPAIIGG